MEETQLNKPREYHTKDGIILRNVPPDVPDEQIKARIELERANRDGNKQPDVQKIEPTSGMGDYEKRAYDIDKSDITSAEKTLQSSALGLDYIYNTAAEEINDFLGETPKRYIKNSIKTLVNATKPLLKTPTGQLGMYALKEGGEKWDEFESQYPRISADIKAAGQIGGTAILGTRPALKLTKKAFFGKQDYLRDIIYPHKIKDINLKNMRTSGVKGKAVIEPGYSEKKIINALDDVSGLNQKPTPARAYEYISSDLDTSANKLRLLLEKRGTKVNNKEVSFTLKKAANNFDKHFEKSKRMDIKERDNFYSDAIDRIGNPKNTAELLNARKEADKRFRFFSNDRRMKGELQPTRDEMKWRTTRDSLNALLEMKEPGYKVDIGRQHNLYKAMDILDGKVRSQIEDESKSFIEKHIPKVTSIVTPRIVK